MDKNIPSSELIIRPALLNDIPLIIELAAETWPPTYNHVIGKAQVKYMLELMYSYTVLEDQMKSGHYFFIAFKNYKATGFTSFSKLEEGVFKLQKLYVLPTLQKTGTGKALLDTVETVAKSMGAKQLILNVNRKNTARYYYEKNGFFIIREEDNDIGGGYFMNDYVMGKDI